MTTTRRTGTPTTRPTDTPTPDNTAAGRRPGATVVVANPASGGATDDDELRAAFADQPVVWSPTTADDPGVGQAAQAVADGATTVVACGGDGTVRAVLESLAGSATTLGVVALGTGNLLASNLGVVTGLAGATDAVAGPARRIDVGTVNGERFAVMAGVGFDAAMIRDADPDTKRRVGSLAYVAAAARNIPARLTHAIVDVDGRRVWAGRTAMVLVGNCGSVTGGLEVFPDARPDDGVLDVAILSAKRPREWASVLWRLLRGRGQRSELVARATGRSVRVVMAAAMPYELDGEDRQPVTQLDFGVQPGALSVRVPAPSDGADAGATGAGS